MFEQSSVTMMRVLLTGFEPFGDNTVNVSSKILDAIDAELILRDPWASLRGYSQQPNEVKFTKLILPVDESGSLMVSELIMQGNQWDAIVHTGLCETCDTIKFETTAKNLLHMRMPDNDGRQVVNQVIGDRNLMCSKSVINAIKYPMVANVEISNDAGTYLCNETYYRTLESLARTNRLTAIPTCFIHFPDESKVALQRSVDTLSEVVSRLVFKPVIEVVGALIKKNNQILLARRKAGLELSGMWEFPGGKVEHGESYFDAIKREMKEEFTWEVTPVRKYHTEYHEYQDFAINLHIVEVILETGSMLDTAELWTSHDDVNWVSESGNANIAPADSGIVDRILAELNAK